MSFIRSSIVYNLPTPRPLLFKYLCGDITHGRGFMTAAWLTSLFLSHPSFTPSSLSCTCSSTFHPILPLLSLRPAPPPHAFFFFLPPSRPHLTPVMFLRISTVPLLSSQLLALSGRRSSLCICWTRCSCCLGIFFLPLPSACVHFASEACALIWM